MSLPRYPKYKASGVEWFEEVPAHWEVQRLKQLLLRNDGGVWGDDPIGRDDTVVLRSTDQTVDGRWKLDDPARRNLTRADREAALLEEGDLLVTKSSGSAAHIGKTTLVSRELAGMKCCFSNFMQRLRVQVDRVLPRLAWFILNSQLARTQFDIHSSSTTGLANLNGGVLGDIAIAIPPHDEQVIIAAFLDRETARIDALVAEQQRLIELLKEKRQAVISHAVTKGLDPNAKRKPSGIEWLGDVPAHWEVKRLKHVSPFLSVGIVINPSSLVADEGLPFIYGGDIREGVIDWGNARRITPEASNLHAKTVLEDGDLLVVRVGAPGVTAVVPAECAGGNCASVMLMRRGSFNSRWLCSLMNTRVVRFQVEGVQYGAAQEQFNISDAVNFWVPVPPRDEQDQIQAHCDNAAGQFDKLIEGANMAITLLQERRTALISAAVTGEIDVRNSGAATAAS